MEASVWAVMLSADIKGPEEFTGTLMLLSMSVL